MKSLPRATSLAHQWIAERLSPGDHAIDATCGNGHDTKFLAECVGASGSVLAIDLQPEAIAATRDRCAAIDCRIRYEVADHARLAEFLEPETQTQAIMFNLGYLPTGDKSVITQPESTVCAIEAAIHRLAVGGLMTLAVYTGHPGGGEEAAAVSTFVTVLDQSTFGVVQYGFLNQENNPPHLIGIERRR